MYAIEKMLPVLILALLLFGGTKIPELMKGLGQGMKEFKKGMREDDEPKELPDAKTPASIEAPKN